MARGKNGEELPPIIIKKVKKVAGGHHGGAWKVAYADFVTAMMAFFMLLWLLTVSDKVVLQGLADYFTPANATISNSSGSGKILGGTSLESQGAKSSGSVALSVSNPSPESSTDTENRNDTERKNSATWDTKLPPQPDANLLKAEEQIKTAIQETPDLNRYKDQVILEQTPDGLRIQLIDRDQRPMFRPGTADLYPFTVKLFSAIAAVIAELPNRIIIQGHTDNKGAASENSYGNWELSADRANASRRSLKAAGVSLDRFAEVTGRASSDPLYPDQPDRPENRRIAIVLMREAPVLAPNLGQSQ